MRQREKDGVALCMFIRTHRGTRCTAARRASSRPEDDASANVGGCQCGLDQPSPQRLHNTYPGRNEDFVNVELV